MAMAIIGDHYHMTTMDENVQYIYDISMYTVNTFSKS